MSQIVSSRPLETCVFASLHYQVRVYVAMANDNGKGWVFAGDKIYAMAP